MKKFVLTLLLGASFLCVSAQSDSLRNTEQVYTYPVRYEMYSLSLWRHLMLNTATGEIKMIKPASYSLFSSSMNTIVVNDQPLVTKGQEAIGRFRLKIYEDHAYLWDTEDGRVWQVFTSDYKSKCKIVPIKE